MLRRFASNAGANVFSGVVAAGYQLGVTALGVQTWHGAEFASWALALSVAAIAPIFAANLSSVITRRVVEARHGAADANERATVIAGQRIGKRLAAAAIGVLIVGGVAVQARSDAGQLSTSAFTILLVVLLLTNSWLVLWQCRFGQHFADERNWLPALTLAAARFGGGLTLFAVLSAGRHGLFDAALGLCAGTWLGLAAARWLLPSPRFAEGGRQTSPAEISQQLRTNLRLLSGFAVGATSLLVIQYSIPPLMALIAPERFNAFYLASTVNTVSVGVLAAATSAMLAPFTRWHARGDTQAFRQIVLYSPALCAGVCFLVLCFCWYTMEPVLKALTSRAARIEDIRDFLAMLGFQTIIRNSAAGYATYVSSAGTPRQMGAPLAIEIALAFVIAVPAGWFLGENALLYGMSAAGLIGSLYTSKVLASLPKADRISPRVTFPSLFGAQAAGCALWWFIVNSRVAS